VTYLAQSIDKALTEFEILVARIMYVSLYLRYYITSEGQPLPPMVTGLNTKGGGNVGIENEGNLKGHQGHKMSS
jgi:hypothetical protein